MTTEERVLAILERANPVPPIDVVDVPTGADRYLEDIHQRSSTVTIHSNQTSAERERRGWYLGAVAASVVAIVIASIAVVVATRDDATPADQPQPTVPPTTVAPPSSAPSIHPEAARAAVDRFFTVYNTGDTDGVMALMTDDVTATEQYGGGTPNPNDEPVGRTDIELRYAWNHAQGEVWTEPSCELMAQQSETGTTFRCRWSTLDAVVQAVDGDPIPTVALIVVKDGRIGGVHSAYGSPDFATLGFPFSAWLDSSHPGVDEEAGCCAGETREESERRGAVRVEWARQWGAWLEQWGCTPTSGCTVEPERWRAEYDASCTAVEPSGTPTPDSVAEMRLVPPAADALGATRRTLLEADDLLVAPDVSDELAVELQRQRLDAMVELGIDERCHPSVG